MNPRKKRVCWTDEETALVVHKAVLISFEDLECIWPFVARAQSVLPTDRQRTIGSRQAMGEAMVQQFEEERRRILDQCIPQEVSVEKRLWVERPRADILNAATTEELLQILVKRLTPIIDKLPTLIREGGQPVPAPETPPGEAEKPMAPQPLPVAPPSRRPRILLYSFLPGQQTIIAERARGFELDLVFYDKQRQLSGTPPSCQWCVVLNKTNHSVTRKLRDNHGERVTMVEGIDGALSVLANLNSRKDL